MNIGALIQTELARIKRWRSASELFDRVAVVERATFEHEMVIKRLLATPARVQVETVGTELIAAESVDESTAAIRPDVPQGEQSELRLEALRRENRLIELDFAIMPKVRHGWGLPDEDRLARRIGARRQCYLDNTKSFAPFINNILKVATVTEDPKKPYWKNDWISAFDALSIYAQLVLRNPPIYLEIGSGISTKFARQAIDDFGLRTKIVSIDPFPRSDVNSICDEIVRLRLEEVPLAMFSRVTAQDMLFFDGSHRAFQNSDATVFFTEVLPALPAGILTGIHDIYLPSDYPPIGRAGSTASSTCSPAGSLPEIVCRSNCRFGTARRRAISCLFAPNCGTHRACGERTSRGVPSGSPPRASSSMKDVSINACCGSTDHDA